MSRAPRYPVYIPSKGRAGSVLTMRHLDGLRVPYRVIVESQEADLYAEAVGRDKILVLDPAYQRAYRVEDDHGLDKSPGSGPARNFAWDHAASIGAERHWIMDDNIAGFYRLNRNEKIKVGDGTIFRVMEDFVDRYENIAMAGPHYDFFVPASERHLPCTFNTRLYSCILIKNDIPFRWHGRYNEDVILSIDVLKAGWCTVQFKAFLQKKMTTQAMTGGNTDAFYAREGTLPKSQMLANLHPDVARVVWRFNRWHHHVDYRPFRGNRLIRRPGVAIDPEPDDYGMELTQKGEP